MGGGVASGVDAFDADILIYASRGDRRGDPLLNALGPDGAGALGSVLLLTETLTLGGEDPSGPRLRALLARMTLLPVDAPVARLGAVLRATYGLKTPDALHLATAIASGASRFVTNNRRDFGARITEIDIVVPSV